VNLQKIMHRILCVLFSLFFLSGCAAVRPVSGEPANGAGRYAAASTNMQETDITICVDAGHGFDDIGTFSDYLGDAAEKDITLPVAFHLKEALESAGFTVIMTHVGESFPRTSEDDVNNVFNPQERVAYADTLDIDYFISVHCDSYTADSSVNGTRIYCSKGTKYSKESLKAAQLITESVNQTFPDAKKSLLREMSEREAYYVIRETQVPSALVEIGFVTNRTDALNMLNDEWRKGIAQGISDGIVRFFTE